MNRPYSGDRMPRPGDLVSDGHDGLYPVVAVSRSTRRLLLRDPDGTVFVIRSFRLQRGCWRLVTATNERLAA